ncbi:MAG: hypothetical protein L0Z62_46835 [Gemmataceae bacterium]|nr:hypothetical protein [Gemmataceae bacterium]
MDYYANVDEAVEAAILGPKRNDSRNTARSQRIYELAAVDVNPSGGTALEEEVGS